MQNQNLSLLIRVRFPALGTCCMYLLRVLIRGCLHATGVTFVPAQVHPGPLLWLCIRLHDTTRKCHTGTSHNRFTPVAVPEREFHSGTKSRSSIMQTKNNHSFQHEISLPLDCVRTPCLRLWFTHVFNQQKVSLRILKRNMKLVIV